jgi:hypothetical protein
VRAKARDLLGRDSESLSDRNFPRILKDAHDSDVIDLRRRGDDFEIARAADAESVSDQLAKTAAANAPPPPAAPAAPRGMGPRGVGGPRGRGKPGAPPADLLSIGVVGPASGVASLPTLVSAPLPVVTAPAESSAASAPSFSEPSTPSSKSSGKPRAKRAAKRATPEPAAAARKTAAKKTGAPRKPRAKKVAAGSES